MAFESIVKFKTIRNTNKSTALLSFSRTVGGVRKDGSIPMVLVVRLSQELREKMECPDNANIDVLVDQENRLAMLKVGDRGFKLSIPKTENGSNIGHISFNAPEALTYIPDPVSKYELKITSISPGQVVFEFPTFDTQPTADEVMAIW